METDIDRSVGQCLVVPSRPRLRAWRCPASR